MSGSTTVEQLLSKWMIEIRARRKSCQSASGAKWREVFAAHEKKVSRQKYKDNRAEKVAYKLLNAEMFASWGRGYLPVVIHIFGNSGTPKGKRRDE